MSAYRVSIRVMYDVFSGGWGFNVGHGGAAMSEMFRGGDRSRLLFVPAFALALVLLGGLAVHLAKEVPGSNSYALLADAFIHRHLDVERCFDEDCVTVDGKNYVIFPPVPALLATPFIALFGLEFRGFDILGFLSFATALWLWWRIFEHLKVERETALWLLLALAFGSPLYFVSVLSDKVWFYAQNINFLLATLALHEVVRGGRLLLAGVFMGLAFLSRQMTILLCPFIFVLALRPDERLVSLHTDYLGKLLRFGLPVLAAVVVYIAYNEVRFGSPLETGYRYLAERPYTNSVIADRLVDHGLFSTDYVVFNTVYMFFQGFHLEWGGAQMLTPLGLDRWGTSLLAASPFVLLGAFMPFNRVTVVGALCAAAILTLTLFYHGNGYSQYNVQRFVLDWAIVLFFVLGVTVGRGLRPAFAVLTVYALALNVVTMVALTLLR